MKTTRNKFKQSLFNPEPSFGLWVSLADTVAAEISAASGFDWLVLDAEHAPNGVRSLLTQLQTVAAYDPPVMVRPLESEPALFKQLLDIGTQTILAPMVETPHQAEQLVKAMRYPPDGIRGVTTARAARWGLVDDYWEQANQEACLVVQIESSEGLANLAEIAAIEGVDAVFVGPSDLAADLGYLGRASHTHVTTKVVSAIQTITEAGKPAGTLGLTPELADLYTSAGATFIGTGVDTILLAKATSALAESFKEKSAH